MLLLSELIKRGVTSSLNPCTDL